jgi:hypothetical protein
MKRVGDTGIRYTIKVEKWSFIITKGKRYKKPSNFLFEM